MERNWSVLEERLRAEIYPAVVDDPYFTVNLKGHKIYINIYVMLCLGRVWRMRLIYNAASCYVWRPK